MPMPRSLGSSQVTFLPLMKIWPSVTVEQAGDAVEQGRLAAAGRSEQDEELALLDIDVEVAQHLDLAEIQDRGSGSHRYISPWRYPFTAPAAMPRTNSLPEMK